MASYTAMGRPPVGGADWSFSSSGGVCCYPPTALRCPRLPSRASYQPPQKPVYALALALGASDSGGPFWGVANARARRPAFRLFGELSKAPQAGKRSASGPEGCFLWARGWEGVGMWASCKLVHHVHPQPPLVHQAVQAGQ